MSGGTPPYTLAWNFGDGVTGTGTSLWILHTYTAPANYTVTLTVTDSALMTATATHQVTVQEYPVARRNWTVFWNFTTDDGLAIYNVTYGGTLIIRDARLAANVVRYLNNLCGPFYDEHVFTGLKNENVTIDNSANWFQIHAEYYVPGYYYQQFWRFYPTGRFDVGLEIGHGGCATDHVYESRFRIDLSLVQDQNNFMSQFTPSGAWQDLIWEGNYTDNGFRDQNHNATQWRFGGYGKYYYITPLLQQGDSDLPFTPSKIFLVRDHPNEIESSHNADFDNPIQWVNGELAFRRNIAFWFLPKIASHGPFSTGAMNVVDLAFYPG